MTTTEAAVTDPRHGEDAERVPRAALDRIRAAVPAEGDPRRMLPAAAYTDPTVLAWERRHLMAGSWTALGRAGELLVGTGGTALTQRALMVGDLRVLLVGGADGPRLFANVCRHRGHELLGEGQTSTKQSILCPYHAWTFDLGGSLRAAPGFRDVEGFDPADYHLVELPLREWGGWLFGHAVHPLGSPEVPDFEAHVGDLAGIIGPYRAETLQVAARHTYEIAANWKVIAENYHECYHCPLIHPELCQVSPPTSGVNYDLPGAWIGGSMDLRDQMASMTLTGELAARPIPGVDPTRVEYVHLLPNLLISAHPDYVMTHRMVPLEPGRTWVECTWLVLPDQDGSVGSAAGAVEFWDLTNKQDWAACESVQRGLASPHFVPGPFAPNEDAVSHLVAMIGRAYHTGRLLPQ